jgi:integrase
VNAGIPQRVVDTWMGHVGDKSMSAVYYHLSDEDSQKFMRNLENLFSSNDKEC